MALKKNDRVQTIGGILGTVLEVSDTEVVLKIDEANNTKIRVLPSAVSKVIEQK
jgi:preprotein translocase YajC subunit